MRISHGTRVADVRNAAGEASIDARPVAGGRVVRDAAGNVEAVEISGELVPVRTARDGDVVFVWCAGRVWELRKAPEEGRSRARAEGGLTSPMPGRVRKVLVSVGDHVEKGTVLLILEAMKMEHAIRAPRDGRVVRIAFGEGDLVDAGVELVEIGEESAPPLTAAIR
ncbi:MAG TPA: biotin/lipoyl-containing protein [Thermoanaerobaculia bacterium]|nr:biotin/lipoyl-containing protein [Thermoanaerobaculia bacterium]